MSTPSTCTTEKVFQDEIMIIYYSKRATKTVVMEYMIKNMNKLYLNHFGLDLYILN